jgi:ATP adenylyltransferase
VPSDPGDPAGTAGSGNSVFAGVPDSFGRLWTPHRMAYIKGEGKPSGPGEDEGCPFDRAPQLSDEQGLIVARGSLVYVVLNLYPYTAGHLLVVPYRHVADYTDLTVAETAEFAAYTQRAIRALRQASGPHGFNIGINLGSVAGAGIAAHLHQHVVPRWGGDTNFMPVVGRTRVLPQLLADTRELLADAWREVLARGDGISPGGRPSGTPAALRAPLRCPPQYHAAGRAGGPPQARDLGASLLAVPLPRRPPDLYLATRRTPTSLPGVPSILCLGLGGDLALSFSPSPRWRPCWPGAREVARGACTAW